MNHIVNLKDDIMARLTDYYALTPRRPAPCLLAWISAFLIIFIILIFPVFGIHKTYRAQLGSGAAAASGLTAEDALEYITNFPIDPTAFGQMGQRVQLIAHRHDYLEKKRDAMKSYETKALEELLDNAITGSFPFLRNPSASNPRLPFQSLRSTYKKGTRGIVISLGKKDFRFACHLIKNIRDVLKSTLPIQIAYAGNDDLPIEYREKLVALGKDIETMDLLPLVDDKTLDLAHGKFATKPVAMLVTTFEQVILVDADSVFIQPPEVLFKSKGYKDTGTYMFHDRLLNKGVFQERHEWWESHLKYNPPSTTLQSSASYSQNYSAEQDSGVVVFDKSRLPVLLGLLHICWQNSIAGREYMIGKVFGDKETYWFGLELSQVPYHFEKHYGDGLGPVSDVKAICGNAIAHMDEVDRLLWFNGALLKNKYQDKKTYGDFSHYMLDGHWQPQNGGEGISCQDQGDILLVNEQEKKVLSASIKEAKLMDEKYKDLISF